MKDDLLERTKEMTKAAEQMSMNLGVPGAIIVFGMLLKEGLDSVARAVRDSGDISSSIEKIADAVRGIE